MSIKRIHVNQFTIKSNTQNNKSDPIFSIYCRNKVYHSNEVLIGGPSQLKYDQKGLKCGAKAYIETTSPVKIENGVLL